MENGPAAGRCILIADQDNTIRELLATLLRMEGYETDEVAELPEALERVEENSYDLVISDLFARCSRPTRPTNAQQLQQRCHPVPVGLLTGWRLDNEAVKQAGFAFLLGKPFDLDVLLKHIANCLNPPFTAEQAQHAHLIRRALQAVSAGDWETLRALCTPTLSYYQLTRGVFTAERAIIGIEAYVAFAQRVRSHLPGFRVDQVVVFQHAKGLIARYRTSWKESDGTWQRLSGSAICRFRGERISQMGVSQPRVRLQALVERAQQSAGD